jgi:hypothetical protein
MEKDVERERRMEKTVAAERDRRLDFALRAGSQRRRVLGSPECQWKGPEVKNDSWYPVGHLLEESPRAHFVDGARRYRWL